MTEFSIEKMEDVTTPVDWLGWGLLGAGILVGVAAC